MSVYYMLSFPLSLLGHWGVEQECFSWRVDESNKLFSFLQMKILILHKSNPVYVDVSHGLENPITNTSWVWDERILMGKIRLCRLTHSMYNCIFQGQTNSLCTSYGDVKWQRTVQSYRTVSVWNNKFCTGAAVITQSSNYQSNRKRTY